MATLLVLFGVPRKLPQPVGVAGFGECHESLSLQFCLACSLSLSLSLVDPTVWRKILPTDKALRSRVNYVTTLITPEHTYTHRREIDPRTECGVFAIFFEHSYPHHRAHPGFLAGNYRLNRCCNQCSVRFVFC